MVPCAERTPLPNGLEAWSRCGARAYPLRGGTKYEGFATIRNWIDQLSQTVVPVVFIAAGLRRFFVMSFPLSCAPFFVPVFRQMMSVRGMLREIQASARSTAMCSVTTHEIPGPVEITTAISFCLGWQRVTAVTHKWLDRSQFSCTKRQWAGGLAVITSF
jgi:hypothetical protein